MVADCKKGRIDRVLTKSLSRFARNTADALMYARILRENGVSILFEKENIDTAFMSSELLLALSGAQAQEESISISKNMRWSIERRMKEGTYVQGIAPFGYRQVNSEFVINEEEAEIVRWIFESYLSGVGKKDIADILTNKKIPKAYGTDSWSVKTVNYILRNVRYCGDALFQKRYNTETLPFRTIRNRGEKPQYYVEETNPAIISKEDFYAAQERLRSESSNVGSEAKKYPLQIKVKCKCGYWFRRKVIRNKVYWVCSNHDYDKNNCDVKSIQNRILECATKKYEQIRSKAHITQRLKAEFERSSLLSDFHIDLFEKTVSAIRMNIDGQISIVLKNGNIIGKGETNGECSSTA